MIDLIGHTMKKRNADLKVLAERLNALEARLGMMEAQKAPVGATPPLDHEAEQRLSATARDTGPYRYRAVDNKGRVFLDEAAMGCDFTLIALPGGAFLLEPTDELPSHQRWIALPKPVRQIEDAVRERNRTRVKDQPEPHKPAYEADDGPLTERDLRVLEKRASKVMPQGPVVSTSSLFAESAQSRRKRTGQNPG